MDYDETQQVEEELPTDFHEVEEDAEEDLEEEEASVIDPLDVQGKEEASDLEHDDFAEIQEYIEAHSEYAE